MATRSGGRGGGRGALRRGRKRFNIGSRLPTESGSEEPVASQFYVEQVVTDQANQEFYFVEQPDQDLYCPVTLEILLEPHQTDCCGQHISEKAANRIIKDGKPCPMCKDDYFTTHTDKYFKRNTINKLRVYCLHKKSGCEWTGELGDLNNHSTSCPKRPWKCQYCGLESTFDVGTNEHTPTCDQYPLPCPNECEIGPIPRCKIGEHLLACPTRLVECEFANVGCDVKVPKSDLARHMTENAQHHLMSATLLNLRLTRELHQKMEEKDQQITKLQQQMENLDTKVNRQAKDISTKIQLFQANFEQQNEELKVKGAQQAGELQANFEDLYEMVEQHKDTINENVLLLNGFSCLKITLTEFKKHQAQTEDGSWYSEMFYSSPEEYCFVLNVDTNGHHYAHGTHLSVFLFQQSTDNDKHLDWPINCTVHLQMLNQLGDYGHLIRRRTIKYEKPGNCISHIGHSFKFYPLDKLDYDASTNTQYLQNDCLKFVLYLRVD